MKQTNIDFIDFFTADGETYYTVQYHSGRRGLYCGNALPKTADEFIREREEHASWWECFPWFQEDGQRNYTYRVWCDDIHCEELYHLA